MKKKKDDGDKPVTIAEWKVGDMMYTIASKTPAPGGGTVAALALGFSAALAEMVLNFSIGKKSLAKFQDDLKVFHGAMQPIWIQALSLAAQDHLFLHRLSELWKLDKNDPERQKLFPPVLEMATGVQVQVMKLGDSLLRILEDMPEKTNPNLRSDVAIAAVLAEAAVRSAAWTIYVNIRLEHDWEKNPEAAESIHVTLREALDVAARSRESVEKKCQFVM